MTSPEHHRAAAPGDGRHHENRARREATHGRDKRGAPMRNLHTGLPDSVLAITRSGDHRTATVRLPLATPVLETSTPRSRTPQNPLPMLNILSSVFMWESRIQYLCDPQWFRDTASRGPTTIVAPESQSRTCPSDHVSRGNRHFTVDCGRLRQSGPRPDTRLLRQPALEGLTRSAWMDSPRQVGRNKFRRQVAAVAAAGHKGGGGGIWREVGRRLLLSIGYPRMSASGESSTTLHRLLHASGSHPIPPPDDPKTNQYNQDLGLIHSTNGNHLESPNEGSSIDHQVTIYLHAQNITMFPTNETWYFVSQILVSCSGGLILILMAQSTRNMFRIHSDY
ncbi:hypothetical protein F511_02993 [Dorcoceras hygrometricum]|uniref:Uncharacterized protein n=1 Tax=Dorcoceras hygrometricum TaxID=472368 RepID=A0A2Z7A6D5_9LAMI|nr:hypothetical protein F511_02993 [Dorcoceras hygrometricum]